MRNLRFVAFAIAATAIVAACSSGSGSSSTAAASPSGSGLTGKTWQLTAITEMIPSFQGVVPAAEQANYTVEFKPDGSYGAKADCNLVSGTYTTSPAGGLTIKLGPSTLVECMTGSLSSQYVRGLGNAASYAIAGDQLTITLKDGGTLAFK